MGPFGRLASCLGALRRPRGFTVVELLVTISIVAGLVALALPGLQKALLAAKKSKSAQYLRQAGIAIDTYRSDNGNCYPFSAGATAPNHPFWPETVAAYLPATVLIEDYRGLKFNTVPTLRDPLLTLHNNISDYGVNGAVCLRMVAANGAPQKWNSGLSPLSASAIPHLAQIAVVMTCEADLGGGKTSGDWWVGASAYLSNPNYTQRPSDRGTGFVACYFGDGRIDRVALPEMQTNAAHYLIPQ